MTEQIETKYKCALCGYEFSKDDGHTSCSGCPLAGACHMVKCPNCGYEVPVAPEMKRLKSLWKRVLGDKATKASSTSRQRNGTD